MNLEQIYKSRIDHSHADALQAIFDAGYSQGVADSATALGVPPTPTPITVADVIDPPAPVEAA